MPAFTDGIIYGMAAARAYFGGWRAKIR